MHRLELRSLSHNRTIGDQHVVVIVCEKDQNYLNTGVHLRYIQALLVIMPFVLVPMIRFSKRSEGTREGWQRIQSATLPSGMAALMGDPYPIEETRNYSQER